MYQVYTWVTDPSTWVWVGCYYWPEVAELIPTAIHPNEWGHDAYLHTEFGVTQLEYYPLAQVKRMVLDGPCGCGDEVR